jgi:hypothetical protein
MTAAPQSPTPSTELDALPRWAPPVVFAVLTLVAFRAYLLSEPGMMLLGQDTLAAGIMFRSFFVEQFRELGRLPLWNPYLFGGVPTIEAGSGDILYPGAWLHFILPLTSALAWKLILHVYLAGGFMYLAARAMGASRWVALFAGVSYQLAPNLVSLVWGGQDGKMYVITLFPAALWLLVRALDSGSLVRFLWLGVVSGLMLIAHPQLAYYAYLALGGYALAAIISRRRRGAGYLLVRTGGGVLSLAVALGVAAIVLLPMYRYLREDSPRAGAGRGFEYAASYSLHAEEMVNFLVPDFSGVDDTYWGRNPLKHNSEYGGVLVLAFGLAAVIGLRGDRRRIGLGIMALIALLYALGASTPAFRLFYGIVPGLRNFRAPSLATFVALAALTTLAALLLERIFRDRSAPEGRVAMRVLAGCGVLALILGFLAQAGALGFWPALVGPSPRIAAQPANHSAMALGGVLSAFWCGLAALTIAGWRGGWLKAPMALGALTLVTAVDLLRVDTRYVEVVRYQDFFPADGGMAQLRSMLGPGERVLAFAGTFPTEGHLAVYRIPLVFGYHGNQLRWYDELTRRTAREAPASQAEAQRYWESFLSGPVLKALATRIVILPGRIDLPGLEFVGGNDRLAIYRNPGALHAATVVPQATVIADSAAHLDTLWSPGFNPAQRALLFEPVAELGSGGGTGTAEIVSDAADSLVVRATVTGPSLLLVSRTWHPSWQAEIEGQAARVVRADYALMGVPLSSPGTHTVVLRYRPAIVRSAKSVSLAAWAVVLVATAIGMVWERRRRAPRA